MRMLRIVAVVLFAIMCFSLGACVGVGMAACEREAILYPDYTTYDAAQLSWVIEGHQERIAKLQDEIKKLAELQNEILNDTK